MTLTSLTKGVPSFLHLSRMTDERGLFEHALHDAPRIEHGYCVDDVARGLILTSREPQPSERVAEMGETYLRFIEESVTPSGRVHNRMNEAGRWTDNAATGDWWGRALWALGVAANRAPEASTRDRALAAFSRAAKARSRDLRAMVYASIGAAEVMMAEPGHGAAWRLIEDTTPLVLAHEDKTWPWPEPRLRYSNGVIPEMLIAAGHASGDADLVRQGLMRLRFLLDTETADGHLSVTGTAGRGPDEHGPQFDQQPIEVATLADACARAFDATGDEQWLDGLQLAWRWFLGANDTGTPMIDPETGAGFDGLTPDGRNSNRGAESTLAALSTYQQARRLLHVDV